MGKPFSFKQRGEILLEAGWTTFSTSNSVKMRESNFWILSLCLLETRAKDIDQWKIFPLSLKCWVFSTTTSAHIGKLQKRHSTKWTKCTGESEACLSPHLSPLRWEKYAHYALGTVHYAMHGLWGNSMHTMQDTLYARHFAHFKYYALSKIDGIL